MGCVTTNSKQSCKSTESDFNPINNSDYSLGEDSDGAFYATMNRNQARIDLPPNIRRCHAE